jgi:hypothetical protein
MLDTSYTFVTLLLNIPFQSFPTLPLKSFLKGCTKLDTGKFSIDCADPLGRTALVLAIENENIELIECLLKNGASPGDALLHAISEEYVEAVERLLIHEESIHVPNTPYVRSVP